MSLSRKRYTKMDLALGGRRNPGADVARRRFEQGSSVGRTLLSLVAGALVLLGLARNLPAAEAQAWPERRGYVDVPMGQMHYRSQGQGSVVLLIHQTPWYSIQWSKVQPRLAAAGYRAIAPDTLGFGFSPPPDKAQPSLEDYADQLVTFLDSLGVRDVALIGHHTGAGLSLVFAHRHPERVRCVVLNGLPLYTDEEREARLKGIKPPAPLKEDGSHLSQHFRWIRETVMGGKGSLEAVQMSTIAAQLVEDKELKAYRALFSYPHMQTALRELRVPVLLLTDADDSLKAATQWAHRIRPDLRYVELDGGGSHVALDNPGPWTEAVLKFLDSSCGGVNPAAQRSGG